MKISLNTHYLHAIEECLGKLCSPKIFQEDNKVSSDLMLE